jgi:uncharacterized protein
VRAWIDDRIEVVVSPLVMAELERVLGRPKLRRYVDEPTAREYVERVQRHAAIVADPADVPSTTRDRADDYLVALARREGVDALVSGDRDLIDAELGTPPVWTPRELVERLTG